MSAYLGTVLEEGVRTIPEIIKAAASSTIGIFTLMIICLSLLAFAFFRGANQYIKLAIFLCLFGGVLAFGFSLKSEADKRPSTQPKLAEQSLSPQATAAPRLQKIASGDSPTPALTSTSTPSAKPIPDKFLPGANLDVWTLPSDFRGDTPPGMSDGSMIDSGTLFNIDNFLTEDSFKALKQHFVGVRWSGYLQIKEQGNHNFIIDKTGNGLRGALWFVSLKIDGRTIIADRKGFSGGESTDIVRKEIPETQLGPGVYDFELFTYSLDILNFTTFQLRVKIRSQSSPNATILDAKSVSHKQ